MTKKERKKLRKVLLKAIADLEPTLLLCKLGVKVGATEPEYKDETTESRAALIQDLKTSKAKIRSCLEGYEKLIDEAIEKMS